MWELLLLLVVITAFNELCVAAALSSKLSFRCSDEKLTAGFWWSKATALSYVQTNKTAGNIPKTAGNISKTAGNI